MENASSFSFRTLREPLVAFVVGLVFGVGLVVARMTDPAKVLAFLDVTGAWDPSLALVMGGAIAVGLVGFAVAARRERTLLGGAMHLPPKAAIDARLLLGSAVFGVGWGLGGLCPGPAIVSLTTGDERVLVFVLAMVSGVSLYELAQRGRARDAVGASDSAP